MNDSKINAHEEVEKFLMRRLYRVVVSILLAVAMATVMASPVSAVDYGDLPANRMAPSGWINYQWDDTGGWTQINVNNHGLPKNNPSVDAGQKLEEIIADTVGDGKRIIYFPAGTYYFQTPAVITHWNIQLKGDGSQTVLNLNFADNTTPQLHGIKFTGSEGASYDLAASAARGDDQVTLASSAGLAKNDYVLVREFVDDVSNRDPNRAYGQIVKVTAKDGNTLTLDMKLGVGFNRPDSQVVKLNMIKNIKVSNLTIKRESENAVGSNNLHFAYTQNIAVTGVTGVKAHKSHITVGYSRDGIISDNHVSGAFDLTTGNNGYGYSISNSSTRINVIDNTASDLRHFYLAQLSANHCVFAYNTSANQNGYGDFNEHHGNGAHNNLWEGNFGAEIVIDEVGNNTYGAKHTTFFRNHATSRIGSETPKTENMNLIGNELRRSDANLENVGTNGYLGANRVSTDASGTTGTMVWGSLSASSEIPNSLFLTSQPSYLMEWPLYGP